MRKVIAITLTLCFALSIGTAHAEELGENGIIAYKGIISERLYKY